MQPLVSILIPCYNAEKWLTATLQSALAQTWPHQEIIVVDDGSTDQSLAIAQSFASKTVQVISQLNRGASAARNRALQVAQGDLLQYLDADDLLSPTKIEAQVRLLQAQPPECLALCSTIHFQDGQEPDTGIFHDGLPFYADSDQPLDWLIRLLGGDGEGAMVHPAAWLTPRTVAARAGDWNETLTVDDDGEYFARVILASQGIRRVGSVVSYYRKQGGSSLSGAQTAAHCWSGLQAIDLKAEQILARTTPANSARAKRALARCYLEWAVWVYPRYPAITEVALQRIRALGVAMPRPQFGSWRGEWLSRLLGWQLTRRASTFYHQWSSQWMSL